MKPPRNFPVFSDAGYPAYVYELRHRPSARKSLKPDVVKVDHGDEVVFVFGKPFLTGDAMEEDKMLSKIIMKYWANFARSGNPNGAGLVTWPTYNSSEQYLAIHLEQTVERKLKEKAVVFWTKTLPEKVAKHTSAMRGLQNLLQQKSLRR